MCVCVRLDFVYLQLELSMQACKDHDAFRGLYELMPHFARVCRSLLWLQEEREALVLSDCCAAARLSAWPKISSSIWATTGRPSTNPPRLSKPMSGALLGLCAMN